MRIVEIRGYELEARLPASQGNSIGFSDSVSTALISIRCEDGTTGWGECWAAPAASLAIIKRIFAPLLLGRDATNRNALWGLLSGQRLYDRNGITHMAISAVDVALWDAGARALGVPVWKLLGGRVRERVPAYASGPYFRRGDDPYARFADEAESYMQAGFRALKLRLGHEPRRDADICSRIRQIIGPDCDLMVDLNAGFDVHRSMAIAEAIHGSRIAWMEEPLRPEDLDGYRRLAAMSPIPIAGGEALAGCESFARTVATGVLDVVQPDVAVCGGLTEAVRISAISQAAGVSLSPHVIGSFVNFFASLHFISILPQQPAYAFRNSPIFEFDQTPHPIRALVELPALAGDGTIAIPDAPGLGFEIDTEALEPFVVDSWQMLAD